MFSHQQYRHFYLLVGDAEQRIEAFHKLSKNFSNPFVTTLTPDAFPAKEQLVHVSLPCYAFNQLNLSLGHTCEALLFDVEQGISANSLAIAAGMVCGGGLFAIGISNVETWLSQVDDDMARYLPWPLDAKQQTSYFKQYFLHAIQNNLIAPTVQSTARVPRTEATNRLHIVNLKQVDAGLSTLTAITQNTPTAIELNTEQSTVFDSIFRLAMPFHPQQQQNKKQHEACFLTAHRGRGKSSLLGILLAELINQGYRVGVTAPRKKALHTLIYHFEQQVVNQFVDEKNKLPFYAPDALLATTQPIDILIVDEAAAIPITLLEALTKHYPLVIFSSTDHGYESGGKGFGLRLANGLQQHSIKLTHQTLTTPVRWLNGDYLERWLDCLLFLYADNTTPSLCDSNSKPTLDEHVIQHYQGQNWLNQFDILPALFHLLINAHYQTSPNDIRWILDDPTTTTWLMSQNSNQGVDDSIDINVDDSIDINCAAIVTEEGPIEAQMAQAVLEGKRRPRGHLLPQSLLAHEGHLDAANFSYWRISRIATQAYNRRQGLASHLLTTLVQAATHKNIDFLCTSFAATQETLSFWQENGFISVRLGTAKDQASGCYSIMMVKPLNQNAQQTALFWHQDYLDNLMINLPRDYQGISNKLATLLIKTQQNMSVRHSSSEPVSKSVERESSNFITEKDQADLQLFIHHNRPYLTVRAQLTRLVESLIKNKRLTETHPHYDFLRTLIHTSPADMDFHSFGLTSKKIAEMHIKSTVSTLLITTHF